ncbi:hypothetical protein ACTXPO_05300 [Psychrobacter celer]|uniref:hypothetical protein n=1 Tax=Psychrobacter celer TaxID=306572 RepID=UPI003FD2D411
MSLTSIPVVTTHKTIPQKASVAMAVALFFTGALLAANLVHAAPEVTINASAGSSTTVVEQYADGKTATITATPNGITMKDGLPYAVTQVTTVPRYTVHQSGNDTVTSVPVSDQLTQKTSRVDVITAPTTTVVTNPPAATQPRATTQIVSTSVDTLQLTPTFSTPGIVNAQTKVMKILKNSDGREIAVPANHIAPGDVIEYHTTYLNTTAQPVTDINAMVSLPNGVQLLSLNSPLPTQATTGGDSYQTIQQVGNTVVIKENYSGLKWNLVDLSPNAAQTVVIRAKVQ